MRTALAVLIVIALLAGETPGAPAEDSAGPPPLKVEGNKLKTADGKAVRLRGVNIPSLEWGQGEHLFDSLGVAIDGWGVNVVRLPLSQDRWFGRTKEKKDGGAHYRQTVRIRREGGRQAVLRDPRPALVRRRHMGRERRAAQDARRQQRRLLGEAAEAFANHPAVLFGLYNEPHDVSWEVWSKGGKVVEDDKKAPNGKREYDSPGMQKLLDVCRAKGAKNVVVAGGLDWAYDLTGIAKGYALDDPKGNGVVYDSHFYPIKKWYTHGATKSQDWDRLVMAAGEKVPVLIGEFGDGEDDYANKVLEYANQHDLSRIAWSMHPRGRTA